jgi:alpha-amylase
VPRTAYVNLFEWSWNDIAKECTNFLGPKGYKAVQVSPPQQGIGGSAWWTRYQPTGYAIEGRSGNRAEFKAMVDTCKTAGVDIYADAVINHMGSGSTNWPNIPYSDSDFHSSCDIKSSDYNDNRNNVLTCRMPGLPDLKTESDYVRGKIADYLKDLLSLGVAGFRVDAAKHMHEDDVAAIFAKVPGDYFVTLEIIANPQGSTPYSVINKYLLNGRTTNEFSYKA